MGFLRAIFQVPASLYHHRKLAFSLAKNDFKVRFAGSYLGVVWAFIQPVITVLVYWFVFQVGFRAGRVSDYPFVLFLVTGIVPWFFFSEALSGGTNSLVEYSYLVKKVVFHIEILPFVKVASALFVHLFFIFFTLVLLCCYGYFPAPAIWQLLYYMICNFILVLGLSYLCSAIVVFFRDLTQIINIIVLQVGMWMTPIMWDARAMLAPYPLLAKLFKLNPMYYIVDGFRDALLFQQVAVIDKLNWTIYFWVVTIMIFGLGVNVFRRLKVHFADVL